LVLSRGVATSICSPAASVIVRFLVARSSFQVRMMACGSCRVSMPGAMASMRAQNSPARVREMASMLAKSSDG